MGRIFTRKLLLSAAACLLATAAMASDYTDENGLEYTLNTTDNTATVVAKSSGTYSGAIVIPETVNSGDVTYKVTEIGEKAFYDCCSSITSLTIPASITAIGDNAFSGSSNTNKKGIRKVYITDLEAYCNIKFASKYGYSSPFYNYNSSKATVTNHIYLNGEEITDLNIPGGVTTIGAFAFFSCTKITKVTIPSSVTAMGNCAFAQCTKINEVHISDMKAWCEIEFGSRSNPLSAPAGTSSNSVGLYLDGELVTELVIPEGTTTVNAYAFYKYTKLTSISFPSTLTNIGTNAFFYCENIKTLYFAGENPPTIAAKNSFQNVSVTSVYVPTEYQENYSSLQIGNVKPTTTACDYSVKTTSISWATGCLPANTIVPKGTTAYYVSAISNNEVTLSEFPTDADGNHIIPANNGFIFNSAEGTHLFTTYSGDATSVENKLTGVPFGGETATVNASSVYVLNKLTDRNAVGFRLYTGTEITANHAYLKLDENGAKVEAFSFGFGEPTGITSTMMKPQPTDSAIYNLQGQRVSQTLRGGLYIQNGKKFIAK